ncbi:MULTISPECIES: transporter substrate-binding domain-containing protein [unclassified Microbacterium]|uniref:transporter substrate-binding domain-containing protein n=1 Tax=unclassified Microbacterium TaxID=2609290 RepID=UPI000EA9F8E0|nr:MULTISPECIES: transporter substrate-binding domain-containing protein [unclassified Microbacterium]MBT2483276.1 transporter substrate-binding domain-containing protein [Microbacterium sp. ISL-108]RKN66315.1 polar amino acid ABC transporter substrate-binding protein [Microbacterium sp. CGR2]
MSRRLIAATALVLTAAALTACSGSDAPTDSGAGGDGSSASDFGLVSEGTLTVATEGTYRPFSFHGDGGTGDLTGYDVEIIEAVAEKLDLDVKFEETQWDAIFAGLDAGRFDVIANQVTINDEREAEYLFSAPYTVSPGVIVVAEDDDSISSFDDLAGKTTAQSLTSNWNELATESGAKVEAVEGWAQAVALLRQGRVDATINDKLTFLDYEQTDGPTGLKIAAETEDAGEQAFVFAQDKTDLVEAVDAALEELRADGTLAEISDKYFGADVTE